MSCTCSLNPICEPHHNLLNIKGQAISTGEQRTVRSPASQQAGTQADTATGTAKPHLPVLQQLEEAGLTTESNPIGSAYGAPRGAA